MLHLVIVESIIHRHYHSRVTDDRLGEHKPMIREDTRPHFTSYEIPFVVPIAFDHIAFIIFQKSQKVESETNERMKQYTIGTTFRNAVSRTHNSLDPFYRRTLLHDYNRPSFQLFFFFYFIFRCDQLLENTTGMFFQL